MALHSALRVTLSRCALVTRKKHVAVDPGIELSSHRLRRDFSQKPVLVPDGLVLTSSLARCYGFWTTSLLFRFISICSFTVWIFESCSLAWATTVSTCFFSCAM